MPTRTHFYHTVWKKIAGVVTPLEDIEVTARLVSSGGGIGSAQTVFSARTGSTEPSSMLTNANGVISFYTDPGEYSMLFSDTEIDARISDFTVGHSSTQGAIGGIQLNQISTDLQDQLDVMTGQLATLSSALEDVYDRLPQPGDVMAWSGTGGKTGWFICDGSVMDRASYPLMFAKIGTAFNTGGETGAQFRIPDLRGRTLFGADSDSEVRLADNNARGNSAGTEKHILSLSEIPSHIHQVQHATGSGATLGGDYVYAPHNNTEDSHRVNAQAAGSGGAHNNMPPYMIMNWVIKHDEDEIGVS